MKQELDKYLAAAKAVVYNDKYAKQFVPMLSKRTGAVHAVGSVMEALESRQPIPPEIQPVVAGYIYLMMVEVAAKMTGDKPDKAIMKKTMAAIASTFGGK